MRSCISQSFAEAVAIKSTDLAVSLANFIANWLLPLLAPPKIKVILPIQMRNIAKQIYFWLIVSILDDANTGRFWYMP